MHAFVMRAFAMRAFGARAIGVRAIGARAFGVTAMIALSACSGSSSSSSVTSTPSNHAPVPIDAAVTAQSCYPYALRDGACLDKCDWSKPHDEQGCAKDNWPLICNSDGTCTPEMNMDR